MYVCMLLCQSNEQQATDNRAARRAPRHCPASRVQQGHCSILRLILLKSTQLNSTTAGGSIQPIWLQNCDSQFVSLTKHVANTVWAFVTFGGAAGLVGDSGVHPAARGEHGVGVKDEELLRAAARRWA